MKHNNTGWSVQALIRLYKNENPKWDNEKCLAKAEIIYKELNRLNFNDSYNSEKYFNNNIPFSMTDDDEDEMGVNIDDTYIYKDYEKELIDDKIIKLIIKELDKNEVEEK